jgi:hypothetical protein
MTTNNKYDFFHIHDKAGFAVHINEKILFSKDYFNKEVTLMDSYFNKNVPDTVNEKAVAEVINDNLKGLIQIPNSYFHYFPDFVGTIFVFLENCIKSDIKKVELVLVELQEKQETVEEFESFFNYCLDTNIDWDIYVDNKPYSLKAGDALIFSAVNQVHWRPKREWKEGDFCKIVSFDYSPSDDWRFQKDGVDPLDARYFADRIKAYFSDLGTRKEFADAWNMYHNLGLKIGIHENVNGKIKNGTTANNN